MLLSTTSESLLTHLCTLCFFTLLIWLGTAVRISYTRAKKLKYLQYFRAKSVEVSVELPNGTFGVQFAPICSVQVPVASVVVLYCYMYEKELTLPRDQFLETSPPFGCISSSATP